MTVAPRLAAVALCLVVVALPGAARAEGLVPLAAGELSADDLARRPHEAPLFDHATELPPSPPEYLRHDADGIRFSYHPSARERVRVMIEEAPLVRDELSLLVGKSVLADIEIRVAVGPSDLSRVVPTEIRRHTEVVALPQHATLVLGLVPAPISTGAARADFRRGLAYLALDEASAARTLPKWFRVGFAVSFADDDSVADRRALWWAATEGRVIPLVDLDWFIQGPPVAGDVATAQARDFVDFLLEEPRRGGLSALLEGIREGEGDFRVALEHAFQTSFNGLEQAWLERLARVHVFAPLMGASIGLWVLLAGAVAFRRRWRRRRDDDAEPAAVALVEAVEAMPDDGVDRSFIEITDHEVPKVSHDGRWHTLH